MINPIDVINAAVFAADPTGRMGPGAVARIVVDTLPADDIVNAAARALEDDGTIAVLSGHASGIDYEHLARTVLRSVGGAS